MVPRNSNRREPLVLLAGQIGAGKSAVAAELALFDEFRVISARRALEEVLGGSQWDRRELQRRGAEIDARTQGRWLLEFLVPRVASGGRWVLDSARTRRQTEPILEAITDARLIYLEANEATRRDRFIRGQLADSVKRSTTFDTAMNHATESEASALRSMASLTIETDGLDVGQVADVIRQNSDWPAPCE